jgi:hypothetical protein
MYSIPNPTPKSIMHFPYSPNLTPPLTTMHSVQHKKSTTTKHSYPQAHKSTAGSKILLGASTSNKHYGSYAKVTICSLTTLSPKPRMNAQPSPRMTTTMQSVWQSIPPMHNVTNQLSGLPNAAKLRPTAWVPRSIEPSKCLTRTQFCQAEQSTPIWCHLNP